MEKIGREVERELARGGSWGALPLATITAVWPAAVGDAVARQAWPLRVARDGTLHVATTSSAWACELDRLGGKILDELRARLGSAAPAGLRFAVGPVPEPPTAAGAAPEERTEPLAVPREIAKEAASAASAIDDPDLRELVSRAARASLLRARSGRNFW